MPKAIRPSRRRADDITQGFDRFCARLAQIDLFGKAGEPIPQAAALRQAIDQGASLLPQLYTASYVAPLRTCLPRLIQLASLHPATVETLTGVVYQHANEEMLPALHRLLAVVSDLYRSFLDRNKRTRAGIPLAQALPPLAMFQNDGAIGPYTLAYDITHQMLGASVGVVSLPATYATHPIIWTALTHETGGHDITHADDGLLDELAAGIQTAFTGMPNDRSILRADLARLWRHWLDEATADVYALLNCGPAFVPNLAAFFGALHARASNGRPSWRAVSGFPGNDPKQILDPHPTDVLRPHIGIGAIEALVGLSAATSTSYVEQISLLASHLAKTDQVTIAGNIPRDDNTLQPLEAQVPLTYMQHSARCIGGYIATARLRALNGHSIQDIETWDDADEAHAQGVKKALLRGRPISALGDDAQLLAGATLALLELPDRYDAVTLALNNALDESYRTDPVWGVPPLDLIYLRYPDKLTLR